MTAFEKYIVQGKDWNSIRFTIHDISNNPKTLFSWLDIPYVGNYHMYIETGMGLYQYLGVKKVLGIEKDYLDRDSTITMKSGLHCPISFRGTSLGSLVFAKVSYKDIFLALLTI